MMFASAFFAIETFFIFDTTDFEVCGRKLSGSEIEIWVRRDDDVLAMMGFAKIIED